MRERKGETDKPTMLTEDFNMLLSVIDKTTGWKSQQVNGRTEQHHYVTEGN